MVISEAMVVGKARVVKEGWVKAGVAPVAVLVEAYQVVEDWEGRTGKPDRKGSRIA